MKMGMDTLTRIIDGHGYGWNGSRRYDCLLRLCSWFSCMHFHSMAWYSSGHAPVSSCHRDGLAPCEFHSEIVLFLLSPTASKHLLLPPWRCCIDKLIGRGTWLGEVRG